ncbi:2803_t:CDS:2, partial [Racocetra fulgida]
MNSRESQREINPKRIKKKRRKDDEASSTSSDTGIYCWYNYNIHTILNWLFNLDINRNMDDSQSFMSKNTVKQKHPILNTSSLIRNYSSGSPEGFYVQHLLASNDISLFQKEAIHLKVLMIDIHQHIISPHLSAIQDYDQQPTSPLIGPFKSDLDVCLYLVQHPQIVELALSMMKAGGQESLINQGKTDKFDALPERKATQKVVLRKRINSKIQVLSSQESSSDVSQFNNDDFDFTASHDLNSTSNMLSRSDHLINDDFDSTASHALNSVSDMLSSSNQLISDDFECSFSTTSDASKCVQTLVDGGINFQPLSGEYGPYFKNFTEMACFTWVTKHLISKYIDG